MRHSVLLPAPLRPMSPTFWSSASAQLAPSSSSCVAVALVGIMKLKNDGHVGEGSGFRVQEGEPSSKRQRRERLAATRRAFRRHRATPTDDSQRHAAHQATSAQTSRRTLRTGLDTFRAAAAVAHSTTSRSARSRSVTATTRPEAVDVRRQPAVGGDDQRRAHFDGTKHAAGQVHVELAGAPVPGVVGEVHQHVGRLAAVGQLDAPAGGSGAAAPFHSKC